MRRVISEMNIHKFQVKRLLASYGIAFSVADAAGPAGRRMEK
jgi:hypothetical protein